MSLSVMMLDAQNPFAGMPKTKIVIDNGEAVLDDMKVVDVNMEREGSALKINMDFLLSEMSVRSRRAVLFTPRLINGADSLELPSVGVYGRQRYFFNLRNDSRISDASETVFRSSERPEELPYNAVVDYEPWMGGAKLSIHRLDYGCCNNLLAQQARYLGAISELAPFYPEFVYVIPAVEQNKVRHQEGSAFVDFPVDKTAIYPDYRNNVLELGKIKATIDEVRNDKDVTITSVWLKGFASPESSYKHNTELARERTESLKKHIQNMYHFDVKLIRTDYEPENWEGLRKYVESSDLTNKDDILDIIVSDNDPDTKEWIIKSKYKDDYQFLLKNCYPALRRTDYRISYNVVSYTDPEDIREVMRLRPQNLSLNEFYIAAQGLEPDTQEFADVYETAVRMFPDDCAANLNAANAAMKRKDFVSAQRYLEKAGETAEAVYARGVCAYLTGDLDTAEEFFRQAQKNGVEAASVAVEEIMARK